MSRIRKVRSGLAGLALAILGVGCAADQTTAPSAADVPVASAVKSPPVPIAAGGKSSVPVVMRKKPLSQDITVTQDIGPSGGEIDIKEAGLKVTFSPGAVSQTTSITVTAFAGSFISYGFGPHGTQFSAPVTVEQDMKQTNLKGKVSAVGSIHGAYTPDGQDDIGSDGKASVTEILGANTSMDMPRGKLELKASSFIIKHFSGYILMGG